jgi:hypothetical protein
MTSSATNALKTPLARSLEQFANRKVHSAIELLGHALPCTVAKVVSSGIVTVNFELTNVPFTLPQITVPVLAFEYVRYPIQKGCKGGVISFDAYMGGMSGLGGGTADLTRRPNLSNLMFVPSGNSGWSATDDPNSLVLYGPDGVIIRDLNKKNTLNVNQSQVTFTISNGAMTIDMTSGSPMILNGNLQVSGGIALGGNITAVDGHSVYAGNIHTSGNVVAGFGGGDQVGLQSHTHGGVQPGTGQTNAPTSGT